MIKGIRASINKSAINFIIDTLDNINGVNDIDSRVAIIVPTARALRKLASSNLKNVDLFTIKDFLKYISLSENLFSSKYKFVDKRLRSFFLRKAAKLLSKTDRVNIFYHNEEIFLNNYLAFDSISINLLSFFRELSVEMVSVDNLYKAGKYTDYELQTKSLMNLWNGYNKLLKDNGLVDAWTLDDDPNTSKIINRYDKFIFFIGGYLTLYELKKLKQISEYKDVITIFNFVGEKDRQHKLYEKFLKIDIPEAEILALTSSNCEIFEAQSFLSQVELITFRAAYYHKVEKIPYSRMAIILLDDKLKSYFLRFDKYNIFDITANENIDRTAIFQLLKTVLNIKLELKKNSAKYININTLIEFYNEKNLSILNLEDIKKSLYEKIESNKIVVNIDELYQLPFFDTYLKLLEPLKDDLKIVEVIGYIKEFLCAIKEIVYESEFEAYLKIIYMLDEITELYSVVDDKLLLADIISIILVELSNIKIQMDIKDQTELSFITVSGVLESRALDYDLIFIPELNDDTFPPKSKKDLFLNTPMRLELSLPTYLDREMLTKNYLLQIIARSKRSILSYTKVDDSRNRSSFLNEIIFNYNLRVNKFINNELKLFKSDKIFIKRDKNKAVKKSERMISTIKNMKISATALNRYIACSLQFFYTDILRVRSVSEIEPTISHRSLGNIFHKLLDELHHQNINIADTNFKSEAEKIYANILNDYDITRYSKRSKFIAESSFDIIDSMIIIERKRLLAGYKILETETSYEAELDGIKLYGKIDRVDYNSNTDVIELIDYKFKKDDKIKKSIILSIDKYEDLQLPIYAYLYNQSKGKLPSALYQVSLIDEYSYVSVFDMSLYDDVKRLISSKLQELKDINQPFTMTEKYKTCEWCSYIYICGRS